MAGFTNLKLTASILMEKAEIDAAAQQTLKKVNLKARIAPGYKTAYREAPKSTQEEVDMDMY